MAKARIFQINRGTRDSLEWLPLWQLRCSEEYWREKCCAIATSLQIPFHVLRLLSSDDRWTDLEKRIVSNGNINKTYKKELCTSSRNKLNTCATVRVISRKSAWIHVSRIGIIWKDQSLIRKSRQVNWRANSTSWDWLNRVKVVFKSPQNVKQSVTE
jgi:hypothetical protein